LQTGLRKWGKQLKETERLNKKRHEEIINKIEKFWENNKEEITEEITKSICENIIGQSYLRWDSTLSFFPTLVFKFVNKSNNLLKKQSQVSTRLPVKSAEITQAYINNLRNKTALNRDIFT
jgi:hypothetical protein